MVEAYRSGVTFHSVASTDEEASDVPLKGRADRSARTRRASGLFGHHTFLDKPLDRMENILGGLSNLRVDTVLSAVDKYVLGTAFWWFASRALAVQL